MKKVLLYGAITLALLCGGLFWWFTYGAGQQGDLLFMTSISPVSIVEKRTEARKNEVVYLLRMQGEYPAHTGEMRKFEAELPLEESFSAFYDAIFTGKEYRACEIEVSYNKEELMRNASPLITKSGGIEIAELLQDPVLASQHITITGLQAE